MSKAMLDATNPLVLAALAVVDTMRHAELSETDGTYPVHEGDMHRLWWAIEDAIGVKDLHSVLNEQARNRRESDDAVTAFAATTGRA